MGRPVGFPEPAPPASFWSDFRRAAPPHLKLGWAVAKALLLFGAPLLVGGLRPLHRLPERRRRRALQRARETPVLADVLEVAVVVATLAVFADPRWQAAARER